MRKISIILLSIILISITTIPFIIKSDGYNEDLPFEQTSVQIIDSENHGKESFFIENKGQWDPYFNYIGKTNFGHVGISQNSLLLNFRSQFEDEILLPGHIIEYRFVNSNISEILAENQVPQNLNYYYGSNSTDWIRDVKGFESIYLNNVWNKIDLKINICELNMKYEFIIHPGANASDIKIRVNGQESINCNGDYLSIKIGEEKVYQDTNLLTFYQDNMEIIPSQFMLFDDITYGFDVFDYDRTRSIVIDPLIFSTLLNTDSIDKGVASRINSDGDIISVGYTDSDSFPTTPGAYNRSYNYHEDIYITKLTNNGSRILTSTYIGGQRDDLVKDIVLDQDDNIYITGQTGSTDYPTTSGAFDRTMNGQIGYLGWDIFVTKLPSNMTNISYSTYVGSSGSDVGWDMAIDNSKNVYVTGYCIGDNLPTTTGAMNETSNGDSDGFVFKLNQNGSALVYCTYFGGYLWDGGFGIDVDDNGFAYIAGTTHSSDFPVTNNAFDSTHNGGTRDVFALKINQNGSNLVYSTYIGGSDHDDAEDLCIDDDGYAYITGWTESNNYPTTQGVYRNYYGNKNIIITKVNISGDMLNISTIIGGSADDSGYSIRIDTDRNIYVTGFVRSTNFPISTVTYDSRHNGKWDAFLFVLSSNGTNMKYSSYIGGYNDDWGEGIEVFNKSSVIITGWTLSYNFPTSVGAYSTSYNKSYDSFVLKIHVPTAPDPPINLSGMIGNRFINTTWNAPTYDGGFPITNYSIYRGTNETNIRFLTTKANLTYFNDTTITNGIVYYYYVKSRNQIGESKPSSILIIEDIDEPDIINDYTPSYGTTGERFDFSIQVSFVPRYIE